MVKLAISTGRCGVWLRTPAWHFHFDTKAWRTIPALIFKPGKLTREYIDGKTRLLCPALWHYSYSSTSSCSLSARVFSDTNTNFIDGNYRANLSQEGPQLTTEIDNQLKEQTGETKRMFKIRFRHHDRKIIRAYGSCAISGAESIVLMVSRRQ